MFPDETETLSKCFFNNKTVKDIREYDKKRLDFLKNKFGENNVMVVWEHEYREDPDKTVETCLHFLNSN